MAESNVLWALDFNEQRLTCWVVILATCPAALMFGSDRLPKMPRTVPLAIRNW
jgi:hypothetical protein